MKEIDTVKTIYPLVYEYLEKFGYKFSCIHQDKYIFWKGVVGDIEMFEFKPENMDALALYIQAFNEQLELCKIK